MALTPEDVVNKRFQQTKFREGYDQDEVDDFLDEIVVELRRLLSENEEIRRGGGGDATVAMPVAGGDAGASEKLKAQNDQLQAQLSSLEGEMHASKAAAEQARVDADKAQQELKAVKAELEQARKAAKAAPMAAAMSGRGDAAAQLGAIKDDPSTPENEAESSSSLLVLARRLHDEHVAEGTRRRDELIAQSEGKARQIVTDAELQAKNIAADGKAKADRLVADAEARERETVGRMEEQKTRLEGRIEELRVFEREYRNKLRGYIEGQLNELTRQSSNIEPPAPGQNAQQSTR